MLREIYDPPSLLSKMAKASADGDRGAHRALQKTSKVRRSDQGKGAKEPDLVIADCPVWHECQRGGPGYYDPLAKLEQAESDSSDIESDLWPVAVCARNGSSKITVCMRSQTLLLLQDLAYPDDVPGWYGDIPLLMDIKPYLELLRDDYARRR